MYVRALSSKLSSIVWPFSQHPHNVKLFFSYIFVLSWPKICWQWTQCLFEFGALPAFLFCSQSACINPALTKLGVVYFSFFLELAIEINRDLSCLFTGIRYAQKTLEQDCQVMVSSDFYFCQKMKIYWNKCGQQLSSQRNALLVKLWHPDFLKNPVNWGFLSAGKGRERPFLWLAFFAHLFHFGFF